MSYLKKILRHVNEKHIDPEQGAVLVSRFCEPADIPLHEFKEDWKQQPLTDAPESEVPGVLFFSPAPGKVVDIMEFRGDVVTVCPGTEFEKPEECLYFIREDNPGDYTRLREELKKEQKEPGIIIDARGYVESGETCYEKFIYLCLAFSSRRIIYIVKNTPGPQARANASLARTIAREEKDARFTFITLSGDMKLPEEEITRFSGSFSEVSYITGRRCRKVYTPGIKRNGGKGYRIQTDRSYVITGGLGKLGYFTACWLALSGAPALCLSGRSGKDEEKLRFLEKLGPRVVYITSGENLIEKFKEAGLPPLGGIFHFAGKLNHSLFSALKPGELEKVITPTARRIIEVDKLLKEMGGDFLILASSITAVMASRGQCLYAWEKGFMNGLAEIRGDGVRAVNWSFWKEGGMTASPGLLESFERIKGIIPLSFPMGLITLEKALEADTPGVYIPLFGDVKKIDQALNPSPLPADYAEEKIAGTDGLKEKLGKVILEIGGKIVKASPGEILPDRDLSSYGFDSIGFTDFANLLNRRFGTSEMPSLFFEHYTMEGVIDYFYSRHRELLQSCFNLQETDETPPSVKTAEKEQMKVSRRKKNSGKAVAVIGMACRFPGAENKDVFWENLIEKKNFITEVPPERWHWEDVYGDPGLNENKTNIKWGGFIEGVNCFDSLFFGISPREARGMDPQQRLFLETSWAAFEDAGYNPRDLKGSDTGVFVGVAGTDYKELMLKDQAEFDGHAATGTAHSVIPNRISFLFDFHGPSEPVNTACSSSLVALHRGVEAIRQGECGLVVAGGVNLILNSNLFVSFNKAGMLSPDGKCLAFDRQAKGYVRGEGVCALLLKPLDRAEKDGDSIYGIIRGSAINHGGHANTLTAPNPLGQSKVIKKALENAELAPSRVSYIEAHGTGTPLGDPVEIRGIKQAFEERGDMPCSIGSVKPAIGHLETAAGLAGVIKVLLGMKKRTIPGTVGFKELNPHIELEGTPFYIQENTSAWNPGDSDSLCAGVSSFGFGGVNSHVILEEYKPPAVSPVIKDFPGFAVVSAKSEKALKRYTKILVEYVSRNKPDPASLFFTLQTGRESFSHRLIVRAFSLKELLAGWNGFLEKKDSHNYIYGYVEYPATSPGISVETGDPAGRWIKGEMVDWRSLYGAGFPARLNLPSYPFEKEVIWYKNESSGENAPGVVIPVSAWEKSALEEKCNPDSAGALLLWGNQIAREKIEKMKAVSPLRVVVLQDGDHDHSLPREEEKVYSRFFDGLKKDKVIVKYVIRFNEGPAAENPESLALRFIRFLKARREYQPSGKIHFLYLLPRGEGLSRLFHSAMPAFFRSLEKEMSSLRFKTLDPGSPVDEALLLDEVFSHKAGEREIRFEKGDRYTLNLNMISPDDFFIPAEEPLQIKKHGVYLITGGAGGLGLELARRLKAREEVNLVLMGRSSRLIEGMDYIPGDISRPGTVEKALGQIKEKYSGVNGVIHCAGVIRDGWALEQSEEDLRSVLAPKVEGLIRLDEAFKNEPLDFFISFSSLTALLGNEGQASYALANNFINMFTIYRQTLVNSGERRGRSLCIGWPLWKDGGMKVPGDVLIDFIRSRGIYPLPGEEGWALWDSVLKSGGVVFNFLYGDKEKLRLEPMELTEPTELAKPADLPESHVSRASCLEYLLGLFSDLLGIPPEQLDPSVEFSDYGIDSVIVNKFNAKADDRFPGLSRTVLYEHRTINELACFLDSRYQAPPAPGERIAVSSGIDEIAVIGMSGRYPMAENLEQFWMNLNEGKDCITEVPGTRWNHSLYYSPDTPGAGEGKCYCRWGGFLEKIDEFDPMFFKIPPKDAEFMDPQERLFMECVWRTMEDAGYTRDKLKKLKDNTNMGDVGVFVGATNFSYSMIGGGDCTRGELPSSHLWSFANRVSYFFDFNGPSIAVDSACSSSLLAIHMAAESLRSGECRAAFAGGVNLYLHPSKYVALSRMRMLSPSGRCHTFGDKADGFVPGEGVGCLLLKPLKEAVKEGDRIYGIIKASAMNHGGHTNGYSVPGVKSQGDLISRVIRKADIDPCTISYVEAHGTGTALGDPIEIAALARAYNEYTDKKNYCPIGSVKSNIGHLEAAAGVAGVTKILLQFSHKKLVPSCNCGELNPNIDFASSPFFVNKTLTPWAETSTPRRAAVSSFGAGGVNVHMILEEGPGHLRKRSSLQDKYLFLLSAANKDRLEAYARKVLDYLLLPGKMDELYTPDFFFTFQSGRERGECKLGGIVSSIKELAEKLSLFLTENTLPPGFHSSGETVARVSGDGKFLPVLQRWFGGEEIDWKELYGDSLPEVISLPGYPLKKRKFWISLSASETGNNAKVKKIHPLLGENRTRADEILFATRFDGDEFFLEDHIIGKEKVLPGAAILEMARVAYAYAFPGTSVNMERIIWNQPFRFSSVSGCEIFTRIKRTGNYYAFEVFSTTPDEADTLHAQGRYSPGGSKEIRERVEPLNEGELVSPVEVYTYFRERGIEYGPGFQVIRRIRKKGNKARVDYESSAPSGDEYILHPGILDGAFQSIAGLALSREEQRIFLPYTLGEIRITAKLPPEGFFLVEKEEEQGAGTHDSFSIKICDEAGTVYGEVKDFVVQSQKEPGEIPGGKPGAIDSGLIFIGEEWNHSPVPEEEETGKLWLIGESGELAGFLSGYATAFCPGGDELLPFCNKHLASGDLPELILCHPGLRSFPQTAEILDSQLEEEALRLLSLARELILKAPGQKVRLIYLVREVEEGAGLIGRALSSLFLTINRENGNLHFKVVVLGKDLPGNTGALLSREWGDTKSFLVRYSRGERLISRIKELASLKQGSCLLKEGGRYLVTGGLGGLGLIIAGYLKEKYHARLVLTDIHPPGEKSGFAIGKLGDGIEYVQADLTSSGDVRDLAAVSKNFLGEINGIIHCAGIIADAYIRNKTNEEMLRVMGPKVKGTVFLEQYLGMENLDFFLLFSSIASMTGNLGQGDYAFANRFLDFFAAWRNKRPERRGKTLAINWPLWKEGGMKVDHETETMLRLGSGMESMSTSLGLEIFEKALSMEEDISHFAAIEGNPRKIRKILGLEKPSPEKGFASKAPERMVSPDRFIKDKLYSFLMEILKVEPEDIEEDMNLSDCGIDSVAFTKLTNLINESFELDITPTLFFEHNTIKKLVSYFGENHQEEISRFLPRVQAQPAASPAVQAGKDTPAGTRVIIPGLNGGEERIAIIGMSGRMPGSDDLDEFWKNLIENKELFSEIPSDRWSWRKIFGDPRKEGNYANVTQGAFMKDIDKFDADFFNISSREASLMDPIQRLFLETVWKTIEDAGYGPGNLSGTDTGVFVGVINSEYADYLGDAGTPIEAHMATGVSRSILANRISFLLNWKGPSEPVDTACSSSLVAIDRAVESIRRGRCRMAVAGGVSVMLSPRVHISYNKAGMLDEKGRSRTFDKSAGGYGRGEGVGALLLKELSRAEADGDHIYGVICSSVVNHGGRTNSLTAPSPQSQSELIISAFREGGISPDTVNYIETHGTGTPLGDPIEVEGLKKAFTELYKDRNRELPGEAYCGLGAVKTNVGHLEAAAGMAGMFKVLLALKHKRIPGNRHFKEVNPFLKIENTPFYIIGENRKWEALKDPGNGKFLPRRAGISSFGFGGSNAHIIIEEYPDAFRKDDDNHEENLFVLSARSAEVLKEYALSLVSFLENHSIKDSNASSMAGDMVAVVAGVTGTDEADIDSSEELANYGIRTYELHAVIEGMKKLGYDDVRVKGITPRQSIDSICGIEKRKGDGKPALSLRNTAYTLQTGRDHMPCRLAVKAQGLKELISSLKDYCHGNMERENLFTGTAEKGESPGGPVAAYEKNWDALGRAWVKGAEVPWRNFYAGKHPVRVSLPVYPFRKIRHWIRERSPYAEFPRSFPPENFSFDSREVLEYEKSMAFLNDLGARIVTNALNRKFPGASYVLKNSPEVLVKDWGVLPVYQRLLHALCDIILPAEDGIIREEETGRYAEIYPGLSNHIRLLRTCAENLPEVITGKIPATEVLFPSSSMELVEKVYKGNASSEFYTSLIIKTVKGYTQERDKPVRILEIGAGTGGTSESVLMNLPDGVKEYCYTDISGAFTLYGEKKYGSRYPFAEFRILDIEKNPSSQGFDEGGYDIVLAANVIHATAYMEKTVSNVEKLLKPGGWFVINEITSVHNFFTLTFGLLDGWWLFRDDERRLSGSPLLSLKMWKDLFTGEKNNFDRVMGLCGDRGLATVQDIIVARKAVNAVDSPGKPVIHIRKTGKERLHRQKPVISDGVKKEEAVEELLLFSLADILRREPAGLDKASAFTDLGVDSILAVESVNRINELLSIELRSTDFFNYSNVEKLSRYIVDQFDIDESRFTCHKEERESPGEEWDEKRILNFLVELEQGQYNGQDLTVIAGEINDYATGARRNGK